MKEYIKNNYKIILFFILIFAALNFRFPYYIDSPGGITDIGTKIDIDGYKSEGSFNLAYVREYKATTITMLVSLFNKDWKILKKKDILLDNETDKLYQLRDKILMESSISDAIYVAYTKANKPIKIVNSKLVIAYIDVNSKTDLKVGDEILSINDISVASTDDVVEIVSKLNIGDKVTLKVNNDGKSYTRYAYVIEENGNKVIGLLLSSIREYKTDPKVNVKVEGNESGSSGGLITAISIYNSLISEDLTKGFKIVGTGTIDSKGNVGSIGGVEYKLKSAVKKGADLFIIPMDENYSEAIKLKEKYNYDIKIIGVSTFDEAIEYLLNA